MTSFGFIVGKRQRATAGTIASCIVLLSLLRCEEKIAEPGALKLGTYRFQRVASEGTAPSLLAEEGEFSLVSDGGSEQVSFLDIDAAIFSDDTRSTPAVYRWRIVEHLATSLHATLIAGYDNKSDGVYHSLRLWEATVSLNNRTQSGSLEVTFRSKLGSDESTLNARERFTFRRIGEPPEIRVIDDPYSLVFTYDTGCFSMITEEGTYRARFEPFPDLQWGIVTSNWECNVDVGVIVLRDPTKAAVQIESFGGDFHGKWRVTQSAISSTECGPVRQFQMRQIQYGLAVTVDSSAAPCAPKGGVIYHRW